MLKQLTVLMLATVISVSARAELYPAYFTTDTCDSVGDAFMNASEDFIYGNKSTSVVNASHRLAEEQRNNLEGELVDNPPEIRDAYIAAGFIESRSKDLDEEMNKLIKDGKLTTRFARLFTASEIRAGCLLDLASNLYKEVHGSGK